MSLCIYMYTYVSLYVCMYVCMYDVRMYVCMYQQQRKGAERAFPPPAPGIGRTPPPARGDCSPQAWGAEKDQLAADMRELVIEASRSLPAAQRQAAEEMLMHELQRLTQQAPSAAHGAPLERRADMALARSMHVRMRRLHATRHACNLLDPATRACHSMQHRRMRTNPRRWACWQRTSRR